MRRSGTPHGGAGALRELSGRDSVADSSNAMRRSFCPACGTQVFGETTANAERMVVRVGTLDDASGITPDTVIWTDSAPSWAHIDPSWRSFPRQP